MALSDAEMVEAYAEGIYEAILAPVEAQIRDGLAVAVANGMAQPPKALAHFLATRVMLAEPIAGLLTNLAQGKEVG